MSQIKLNMATSIKHSKMKGLFKIIRNKIKGLLQEKTMDFLIIWDSAYKKHQKLKKNPDAQVAPIPIKSEWLPMGARHQYF